MSQELWHAVLKRIGYDSLSAQMVFQCAPLFAGLKISNLLKVGEEDLIQAISILRQLGYSHTFLLHRNGKVTMLVYERERLRQYLGKDDVRALLSTFGYRERSLYGMLEQFTERYRMYGEGALSYPHETGLFLGYPAADVEGFIRNKGKHYLYSGYWKVYHDRDRQVRLFDRFEQAKRNMLFQLTRGLALTDFLQKTGTEA